MADLVDLSTIDLRRFKWPRCFSRMLVLVYLPHRLSYSHDLQVVCFCLARVADSVTDMHVLLSLPGAWCGLCGGLFFVFQACGKLVERTSYQDLLQ